VRDEPFQHPLVDDLLVAVAEGALRGMIPVGDASLIIDDRDGIERRLSDAPELLLRRPDSVGGPGIAMQLPPQQEDARQAQRHDADRQPPFARDPVEPLAGVDLDADQRRRLACVPQGSDPDIIRDSPMANPWTDYMAGVDLEERRALLGVVAIKYRKWVCRMVLAFGVPQAPHLTVPMHHSC
jgi:hypothetical protein